MAGYPGKQYSKPKPTALRILEGNRGHRPLNDREPRATVKLPSPPKQLSATAKREWRRTGRLLREMGIITEIDAAQFAAYCQSYARWLECQELLAKLSVLIKGQMGLVVNPLLRVARDAQEQFTRALVEFGMSPSSRTRIHAAPESQSSLDALLE